MEQDELTNTIDRTMQEFDFTSTCEENELAAIMEDLSPAEIAAAMTAIQDVREKQADRKVEDFKDWFDAAFLPILKDFAEITGSKLKIEQDSHHDIIAVLSSRCGIDITPTEKMMHTVVSAADHISVNRWEGAKDVEFSLIFGFPDDVE